MKSVSGAECKDAQPGSFDKGDIEISLVLATNNNKLVFRRETISSATVRHGDDKLGG